MPGFQGPYGQPVGVAAPYTTTPPGGAELARSMVRQSVPLSLVQQTGFAPDGKSGVVPGSVLPSGRQLPAEPGASRPARDAGNAAGDARNAWNARDA